MAHTKLEIIGQAMGLREMIGLSPTDIVADIEVSVSDIGYILGEKSFGDRFSAYCTYLENEKFAIVLNTDHDWNENFRRFTISHEIGHLNLIQHLAALQKGNLYKSRPEFQTIDPIEKEADYFAINFLAPKAAFEKATQFKDFSFDSILEIGEYFGISILASAFRFVELTDLTCTLISVDVSTGKVKYEKRSREFEDLGYAEYLYGKKVPPRTNTYDVLKAPPVTYPYTDEVNLIDWYPDLRKKANCTESIMHLGYNNTLVVLLELNEDLEDEF